LGVSPIKDPTFTFPDSGPYYITLYVSNPCDTDSVTKLIIVAQVGFEDLQQELGITVFPNPSDNNFNINIQKMNQEAVTLKLYDMAGRFILTKNLNILNDSNFILEGNKLEKGVYFLQLIRGNKSNSIKLIKTE
jgi:PKD repeat protein